ncbi:unnamed protein product [Urochloa humidicola]
MEVLAAEQRDPCGLVGGPHWEASGAAPCRPRGRVPGVFPRRLADSGAVPCHLAGLVDFRHDCGVRIAQVAFRICLLRLRPLCVLIPGLIEGIWLMPFGSGWITRSTQDEDHQHEQQDDELI